MWKANTNPHIFPSTSYVNELSDIPQCIDSYQSLKLNAEKVTFYEGWVASSKNGKSAHWQLALFYCHYGKIETSRLWRVLQEKTAITRFKTLNSYRHQFISVLNTVISLCPNLDDYKLATNKEHIDDLVRAIFAEQKLDCLTSNHSIPTFYLEWSQKVRLIESLLIKPGLWSEPRYDLHRPTFTKSSTHANTHKR